VSDEPRSKEIAELPGPAEQARDGIGENDHPIPLWFNLTFLATIVFAIVYVPYYHVFTDWSSRGQYEAEVAVAEAAEKAARAAMPTTNPYHGDAQAIADGKQTFDTICAACHKPDGSGLVGPSLVDPYWKYGKDDASLIETVMNGRPAGMPAWGQQLGTDKVWRVLAYMETLPKADTPGVGAPGVGTPGAAAPPAEGGGASAAVSPPGS
jgi:cytochrome c oxidase cbb3-type subunit 3